MILHSGSFLIFSLYYPAEDWPDLSLKSFCSIVRISLVAEVVQHIRTTPPFEPFAEISGIIDVCAGASLGDISSLAIGWYRSARITSRERRLSEKRGKRPIIEQNPSRHQPEPIPVSSSVGGRIHTYIDAWIMPRLISVPTRRKPIPLMRLTTVTWVTSRRGFEGSQSKNLICFGVNVQTGFHPWLYLRDLCMWPYDTSSYVREVCLNIFSSFRIRSSVRKLWKSNLEVHTCWHLYFLSCPYW